MQAFEVFLQARQAFFVGIGAHQVVGRAERGGDEKGLAAGSGAGVEDVLAGLRV